MTDQINYLRSLEPWKGQGGFTLDSVRKVCAHLGNPQDRIKTVHVAGTNGKGSVSVSIAAILGAAGHKVGLITSPHLSKLNERIIVDGCPLSDLQLIPYIEILRRAASAVGVNLTFFEAISLIGFIAFADLQVDYAVVEVGLGGRLDATNVITRPVVSVITNIDFDHEDILGNTLAKIAAEKAGIIKPDSALVVGDLYPEAREVVIKASNVASCVKIYGRDFDVVSNLWRREFLVGDHRISFNSSLIGKHQDHNTALAIQAALLCGVKDKDCITGLGTVFWPARLENVNYSGRSFILDGAHNAAGIKSLVAYLESRQLYSLQIGFGALKTKRWQEMIELLIPFVSTWNLLTPHSDSALTTDQIASFLSCRGISSNAFGSNYQQFISACLDDRLDLESKDQSASILLVGSLYLVGELRSIIVEHPRALWKRNKSE